MMKKMEFENVIKSRRAFRSLERVDITDQLIVDIANTVKLSPSCFNNQPWEFIFVSDQKKLKNLFTSLNKGNFWATKSSMIVAVLSKKKNDCQIKGRDYYLFDTGMGTAYLILKLSELGFVAHPIAGYSEERVKEILKITDEEITVITLIIVGKKSNSIPEYFSESQIKSEKERPKRKDLKEFIHINEYNIRL